jgi:hypothetical protein
MFTGPADSHVCPQLDLRVRVKHVHGLALYSVHCVQLPFFQAEAPGPGRPPATPSANQCMAIKDSMIIKLVTALCFYLATHRPK